jgi:diguanylate cyclase (GGDEF)-like protein
MSKRGQHASNSALFHTPEQAQAFAINMMQYLVLPAFVVDTKCRIILWNLACEKLTGVPASEMTGHSDHWRAFYDKPRPCLADLIVLGRTDEVDKFYLSHDDSEGVHYGLYAENWCVMPRLGNRHYLAIDAGPIYDNEGRLIAAVETLRDMTMQREAQQILQSLASKDGLTGIANRRSFDEMLDKEWRRALRHQDSITLLMVDVDHFKDYNDSYGHQAGDDCLKRIAAAMAAVPLRGGDLVARYGGEEFAVILPNIDAAGGLAIAERIRSDVQALGMASSHSEHSMVTVSIGVASGIADTARQAQDWIAAADGALYRAKHAGRNRVVAVEVPVMG